MQWICQTDQVAYSVGAPACPQCGGTQYWEQGTEPPAAPQVAEQPAAAPAAAEPPAAPKAPGGKTKASG